MNQPADLSISRASRRVARDLAAVALLWVLVLLVFWRIALAGRVLAGGDAFTYFYPYWAEATRAFQAGRLPLWNPYLFMGAPFLANSQVGVFYPLNWPLWFFLPAHQSLHLSVMMHLCLAALNAYLWGRASLRLGRVGAWTVGMIFALGGYLGAQVEHVNQLQGLAWLPLMLVLYDGAVRSRVLETGLARRRVGVVALVGLAVVIGFVLLAGHTQTAFIALVGLAVYGLGPALWVGVRQRAWRFLALRAISLAVAAGAGIALAAIQLLPTGELTQLSVRAEGLPFRERVSFSLSPFYLARAFLPGFSEPVIPEHIEHVAYVGVAALALVAVGVCVGGRFSASKITSQIPGGLVGGSCPPQAPLGETVPVSPKPPSVWPVVDTSQPRINHGRGQPVVVGICGGLLPLCVLIFLGLFLSLGAYNPVYWLLARYVPGFAHFRVPARWLALCVLGLAGLAGWGGDALFRRRESLPPRWLLGFGGAFALLAGWAVVGVWLGNEGEGVGWPTIVGWAAGFFMAVGLLLAARRRSARAPRLAAAGLLTLSVVELFAASTVLPHARATAPQAFTDLRPAIAHLLAAAPDHGEDWAGGGGRFLSMSDITFDPGDLAEIEGVYGPQLSPDELYDYVIAVKHKEVLDPNLPLTFGVPAVDGYDGGVLPLARYVVLQRLFLPEDEVSIDGRLRENLAAVPDGRWLSLFGVRYVITDKLRDAWLDGVFYDFQFGARLERGEIVAVAHVPAFEGTALGIVSYLQGGAALLDGAPVGVVEVGFSGGITRTFELRAGEHTAEGLYGSGAIHAQAPVGGHFWIGQPEGNDYVTRLRWEEPGVPVTISVRATLAEGELVVRGVSLIDERTGGFQALVLSDRGGFRLAHSGDVKIYENLDAQPRAFLVHRARAAASDEEALALMQDASFDPAAEVLLQGQSQGLPLEQGEALSSFVRVVVYTPARIEVEVEAGAPGYLVLTDAWYPGWEATVDGRSAAVLRADLLFRAVAVDAGRHRVVFVFRPVSLYVGAGISLAGLACLVTIVAFRRRFVQTSAR